ncbi:DUF998 domain-containing protein [Dyella sp. C11]|uniref:DUF998 domain-containing protein n=1 Tax=Dyella sp. C11 TaxID=2126991 RepID=UPI00130049F2|nr:DUF998 domain-containing protein [Dyella sp. C11]
MFAVVVFATTACALQWTRTDLDPVLAPLSAYLRGPGGIGLRSAYYLMASALACLAWLAYNTTTTERRSMLPSALFLVAAMALPVVALTVLYEHTPQEDLARLIHGEAAQTTFLCLVTGMVLLSMRLRRNEHTHQRAGIVLAWLAFVQMWVLALWKGLPPGLTQKALIVLILLWLAWVARKLWRASRSPD